MTKLTQPNLVHLRATYPEHRLPDGGRLEPLPPRRRLGFRWPHRRAGAGPDAA